MKSLQEEFKGYMNAVYDSAVPQEQGEEIQQAFFAGAYTVLHVLNKAGVGEIDSRIGANEIEISTDGMMNRTKPSGRSISSSHCALTIPIIWQIR